MSFHYLRLQVGIKLQRTPFVKRWIFFFAGEEQRKLEEKRQQTQLEQQRQHEVCGINTFQKKACVLTNGKWSVYCFFFLIFFYLVMYIKNYKITKIVRAL